MVPRLDDHLSNTLSTQDLAALELLVLERRKQVEEAGEQEENGRHNEAAGPTDQADPLHNAHDQVHDDARPVLLETAEEAAEALRPDGELEQECYFYEEDDRCICPALVLARRTGAWQRCVTYRQMMEKMMMGKRLKMLAIPMAKHRITHSMPVLSCGQPPPSPMHALC